VSVVVVELNGMVWFGLWLMMGMEGGGNEGICRGPKALGTVFTGPYLRTRKRLLYDFHFIFLYLFPFLLWTQVCEGFLKMIMCLFILDNFKI